MNTLQDYLGVAIIALGMVLTPGPNMVYLASRSIAQGRNSGLISLGGVAAGFFCYLLASALGLGTLFRAVPIAYDIVKVAGAVYLLYLAWGMIKPGGSSPFEVRSLESHSPTKLFSMGLLTNLLNPKIALMYAALIPQFIRPDEGSAVLQFMRLGAVQISIAVTINGIIVLAAASVSRYLTNHPRAMTWQRRIAGTVLGVFAIDMLLSKRPV